MCIFLMSFDVHFSPPLTSISKKGLFLLFVLGQLGRVLDEHIKQNDN